MAESVRNEEQRKRHGSVAKTNQDIADRVNESLPVRVTLEDVDRNPEFIKLLNALSQHISDTGISKTVHTDLSKAHQNMQHEKNHWLQQHILQLELQELVLDQQIQQTGGGTPSHTNAQFYKALEQSISLAEIVDYLECSPHPDSEVTLLGLKKEDLDRRNPHKKHKESIQQRLIPEIEARLRKKCEKLVSFHDASTLTSDNGKPSLGKASQLPALLEGERQEMVEEKRQLKRDKASRDKQFWQYHQALMDALHILERLITQYRLQSQKENDSISSKWLASRCELMYLKIKVLEMQLLCDTYHSETVRALHTIRGHLDKAIEQTSQELIQVSQALNAYETVGMGFDNLVQEFTYLQDEVKNKTWALSELSSS